MPLAHAMWIHGHSIKVEYPDLIDDTRRMGYFIRLDGRANTNNWLHAGVPTPVIVGDHRLRIDSVLLRFRTSAATVTAVHVYDGETKIAAHDGLSLAPASWALERFDVTNQPEVLWGLGISFRVAFGSSATRRIEVSAAGGDFLD